MTTTPALPLTPVDLTIDLAQHAQLDPFGTSVVRLQIIGHDGKHVNVTLAILPPKGIYSMDSKPKSFRVRLSVGKANGEVKREVTVRGWIEGKYARSYRTPGVDVCPRCKGTGTDE